MAESNRAQAERRLVIRAGIFVAAGLLLAGLVIVVMGKERHLFDEQVQYVAAFDSVDGLILDAPVRLGGLEVGSVKKIVFANDLGDRRLLVTFEVTKKFTQRIRKDSVARVTSKGVLGDKAVDISLGTPEAPEIPPGGEIQTGTSGDLSALMSSAGEVFDNVRTITRDVKTAVASYTTPEIRSDVAALMHSARNVAQEIETGKGAVHALLYDKKSADDLKALIANASGAAERVDQAVGQLDVLLKDVREGDGTLHALVYDKKIAKAVSELGTAASELAQVVHDAKESPNGAVHQLVYGDSRALFKDLGDTAADLRVMAAKIKAGEGTVGGLIADPTVYEDLKELLGNVKRNRVLKALVRWSISNGEAERMEKISTPPPVTAPAK